MFCYAIFYQNKQIKVFPYSINGDDWKRAKSLAIEFATKAGINGYKYTIEHFGASDVGVIVWG